MRMPGRWGQHAHERRSYCLLWASMRGWLLGLQDAKEAEEKAKAAAKAEAEKKKVETTQAVDDKVRRGDCLARR